MKVIFLDFDGVLNGLMTKEAPSSVCNRLFLNSTRVDRLNRIVEQTGARVVLSTSWRYDLAAPSIAEALRAVGFRGEVIGVTPDHRPAGSTIRAYTPRSDEIRAWIEEHRPEAWVSLDDHDDAGVDGRFVHTDTLYGLSEQDVEAAVRLLGGRP